MRKKKRPDIRIECYEVTKEKKEVWQLFRKYHYLSDKFNSAARTYVFCIDNIPCAFTSILKFPHPKRKNLYKLHRTVVLPDYQGLSIGTKITEYVAEILKKEGIDTIRTTSNIALIKGCIKSSKWIITRHGRTSALGKNGIMSRKAISNNRITVSLEYIGDQNNEFKRTTGENQPDGEASQIQKG